MACHPKNKQIFAVFMCSSKSSKKSPWDLQSSSSSSGNQNQGLISWTSKAAIWSLENCRRLLVVLHRTIGITIDRRALGLNHLIYWFMFLWFSIGSYGNVKPWLEKIDMICLQFHCFMINCIEFSTFHLAQFISNMPWVINIVILIFIIWIYLIALYVVKYSFVRLFSGSEFPMLDSKTSWIPPIPLFAAEFFCRWKVLLCHPTWLISVILTSISVRPIRVPWVCTWSSGIWRRIHCWFWSSSW